MELSLKRWPVRIIACLIFILTLSFVSVALAADCYVGGTGYTLQDAIDYLKANPSVTPTIEVRNDFTINDSIIIDGVAVTIIGVGGNWVIIDNAANTTTTNHETGSISVFNGGTLTLRDITLDGNAQWDLTGTTASDAKNRTYNSTTGHVNLTTLIYAKGAGSTVILDSGAILQNVASNSDTNGLGAAVSISNGIFEMNDGAIIQKCSGIYQYKVCAGGVSINTGSATFNGGLIQSCATFVPLDGFLSQSSAALTLYNANATISGDTTIQENYSPLSSAVAAIEGSHLIMSGDSVVQKNDAPYGGVSVFDSTMDMYGNSAIKQNIGSAAGGILLSNATGDQTNKLTMHENSMVSANTSTVRTGGICINSGDLFMLGNSAITNNTGVLGGGVYVRNWYPSFPSYAHLLSGTIDGNTATTGSGVYMQNTRLDLDGGNFTIPDDVIYLALNKVVTLVGAPSANAYTLATAAGTDDPYGRDVVVPGTLTYNSTTYSVTDATPYASSFTHNTKRIGEGYIQYYGTGDTSHDLNLVLILKRRIDSDPSITGGTATSNVPYAVPGDVITLSATPDSGYRYVRFEYTDPNTGSVITVTGDTFTMPDFDVVFRAVFDPIATDTPVVTATPSPTVPITGDEANPMLWMFVMLGALMVLGGMLTTKWLIKKQR